MNAIVVEDQAWLHLPSYNYFLMDCLAVLDAVGTRGNNMPSTHIEASSTCGLGRPSAVTSPCTLHRSARFQRGIIALNFAWVLIFLIGFTALALELGKAYNRKAELDGVTRAAALAAARELNGTQGGINAAISRAQSAASGLKYKYGIAVPWSESAITFSTAPSGSDWIDASSARASPAGLYYVAVTAGPLLGDGVGTIETPFFNVLPDARASVTVTDRAVAGRTSINITPLAICAMSPVARASRANDGLVPLELVEYGFRRGVNYDLMKLNPNSAVAGANFVVDPTAQPGASGPSGNTSAAGVAPFVCAGRMWMPQVTAGQLRVSAGFPLAALYPQLNSRFDNFQNTPCSPNGAPPDFNVKPYSVANAPSVGWMNAAPTQQAAILTTDPRNTGARRANKLETILDYPLDRTPAVPNLSSYYGPLWSYTNAAKYTLTAPAGGETYFSVSDWPHLYPGVTKPSATIPYQTTSGAYYGRPSTANLAIAKEERRVLNIPLLACPVTGSNVSATVLAVGRFFMTVPATAVSVNAEFAGIASEQSLVGPVELYQ